MIGKAYGAGKDNGVDNLALIAANETISSHPIEQVGRVLRGHMTAMKQIAVG